MATELSRATNPAQLNLADTTPFLSIIVLRTVGPSPARSFTALVEFLRRSALDRGRAIDARITAEVTLTGGDSIEGLGRLADLGFTDLYAVAREVLRVPGWGLNSGLIDATNDLIIALRRNDLVAVCTKVPSIERFRSWINREHAPFEFLPPQLIAGTFQGSGKMVWMSGVHRRRPGKADTQALGGIRLQSVVNSLDHGSYAMRAAKIDFQPEDNVSVLRDLLTVSPGKSRISWKRASYFGLFLAATVEALDMIDKALVSSDEPTPLFEDLATYETDLGKVRGAFDILVADPDNVRGDPDADEDDADAAALLLDALLEVRGVADSAAAEVDVGFEGSQAGTLVLRPVPARTGFDLHVGITGDVYDDAALRAIKETIERSDVLTIYYQSGHALTRDQITHQAFANRPFRNMKFEDFTGFCVAREKPHLKPGKTLHDMIGDGDDNSLFAWVARRHQNDWLLCDDGSGEIGDFLHLDNNGTLTVIHVKAAGNSGTDRRIAVTRYEQVVSQAEKNSRYLEDNDALVEHLAGRTAGAAAWHDGQRVPATDFLDQLRTRLWSDKTYVVIVQPHVLHRVHDEAQASIDAGRPNRDASSLMLLNDLLNSTERTINARCDGLTVIGSN